MTSVSRFGSRTPALLALSRVNSPPSLVLSQLQPTARSPWQRLKRIPLGRPPAACQKALGSLQCQIGSPTLDRAHPGLLELFLRPHPPSRSTKRRRRRKKKNKTADNRRMMYVCFFCTYRRISAFASGVPCALTATPSLSRATGAVQPTANPAYQGWLRFPRRTSKHTHTAALVAVAERKCFWCDIFSLLGEGCTLTDMQGLFDRAGHAVFPQGMLVNSHNVTASFKNRLRTPRLVIIEFILEELPDVGSPGQMLHLSLLPNYTSAKDLHHEKVRFDIKNSKALDKHQASVSKRVEKLRRKCALCCAPPPKLTDSPRLSLGTILTMQSSSCTHTQTTSQAT